MFQFPFDVIVCSGPRSFLREVLRKKKSDLRIQLVAISLANIAFVIPTLMAMLFFFFLQWSPGLANWFSEALSASNFVFLLGDNRISGVLFGILLGGLSALVLRRVWLGLFFCSLGLASGVLALNVGWGVWMGTLLGFWVHQTIRYRKLLPIRSALRWRVLVVVATIMVIFRFSDFLAISIRSLDLVESMHLNRFFQWVSAGALTLSLDTVIAAMFFHFYSLLKKN